MPKGRGEAIVLIMRVTLALLSLVACSGSADPVAPVAGPAGPPPDPIADLHSHISALRFEPTESGSMLVGNLCK